MLKLDLLENEGRNCLLGVPIHQLENKTIMVTGASGLIGTNFLYALDSIQRTSGVRMKVIAVVNREIPEHLALLSSEDSIKFLVGDLTVEFFVNSLPPADIIIHAATYGQPGLFLERPEVTIKLNTCTTLALFEKVLARGGKLLFISTSEIYSGLMNPPFFEQQIGTSTPDHPRACYIEAKRCGEAIVNIYRKKGYDAKSARLSLAYGPGTRTGDKRVLNSFIEKALVQKEIRLLDKGDAKRTYCYVADAVNMMWRILLEGRECVYNVAGSSTVTIAELARLVGKISGVDVIFPEINENGIPGAPEDVRLDISRYLSEFGTREFIGLEKGLHNTIDWQRSLYLKD